MIIGFTGTQVGATGTQKAEVQRILKSELKRGPVEVHHGCCVGADEDFHKICWSLGLPIIGHPPENETKMMEIHREEFRLILPAKPYLERNRDIVDVSDKMIATPRFRYEEIRSGTWYTVRYSRRLRKPLHLVLP